MRSFKTSSRQSIIRDVGKKYSLFLTLNIWIHAELMVTISMLKKQLNDSYSLLPNSNKWNFLWVPIFFPLVAQLKLFSVIFLNLKNTLKVNQDLSAHEKTILSSIITRNFIEKFHIYHTMQSDFLAKDARKNFN